MRPITIVIDGPAGAGKSSAAQGLASALRYRYLNSGALYRAVALYLHQHHIAPQDELAVNAALPNIEVDIAQKMKPGQYTLLLNGMSVLDQLYSATIEQVVGVLSKLRAVRHKVSELQKRLARGGGVVADGRDLGSHVFPQAELKIFMTASPQVRAQRRFEALPEGSTVSLEELRRCIEARDHADLTRALSPLVQAPDAIVVDTSALTLPEVITRLVTLAKARIRLVHDQPTTR